MAGHSGELVPLAASHGELRQSAAARVAGSTCPGQALKVPAIREPCGRVRDGGQSGSPVAQRGGHRLPPGVVPGCSADRLERSACSWTSVVNVWHQRGHQTLVQAASLPGAARPRYQGSIAGPDGDGDACERDPEGILTMTSQMVALLAENYQVVVAGLRQVAGRTAQELALRHRDGLRRPGSGWTPRPSCRCAGRRNTAPGWSAKTSS